MSLSEGLSRLAVRAKEAEDRVAAAKTDAREKLEQARSDAKAGAQETAEQLQTTSAAAVRQGEVVRRGRDGPGRSNWPTSASAPRSGRSGTRPTRPRTTRRRLRSTPPGRSISRTRRSSRPNTPHRCGVARMDAAAAAQRMVVSWTPSHHSSVLVASALGGSRAAKDFARVVRTVVWAARAAWAPEPVQEEGLLGGLRDPARTTAASASAARASAMVTSSSS